MNRHARFLVDRSISVEATYAKPWDRREFVKGVATGRLLPPVLASATKASWIRTFAEREGLSLSESFAYSDSISDLPMLSIVGHPAAVNPDLRLRQTALHHDWPILNLK